jgi:tryprostatin B 6-hydroxylase
LRELFLSELTPRPAEAAFEKPQEFIPERWYLHPNMVKDKSAHAPFSTGTL